MIEKICVRVSRNGGRAWAKPALLDKQVRENRERAIGQKMPRDTSDLTELRSVITIQGLATARSADITELIMQQVCNVVGITMRRGEAKSDLSTHEWAAVRNLKEEWSGRIRIVSATQEEVLTIFNKIHGSAIEVNGMSYVLEVDNAYASLDASAVQNLQITSERTAAATHRE